MTKIQRKINKLWVNIENQIEEAISFEQINTLSIEMEINSIELNNKFVLLACSNYYKVKQQQLVKNIEKAHSLNNELILEKEELLEESKEKTKKLYKLLKENKEEYIRKKTLYDYKSYLYLKLIPSLNKIKIKIKHV